MKYDAVDVLMFLVKKAIMAGALGMFVGYFFLSWVRAVSSKIDHNHTTA